MTAFDLIDSIFARPQNGVAPEMRWVSPEQMQYLRDLIDQDAQAAKLRKGAPGSLVWTPAGKHKYILTEDLYGKKRTLTRLTNIEAMGQTNLFQL